MNVHRCYDPEVLKYNRGDRDVACQKHRKYNKTRWTQNSQCEYNHVYKTYICNQWEADTKRFHDSCHCERQTLTTGTARPMVTSCILQRLLDDETRAGWKMYRFYFIATHTQRQSFQIDTIDDKFKTQLRTLGMPWYCTWLDTDECPYWWSLEKLQCHTARNLS